MSKKVQREFRKDYGAIYKHFLTFDKILENLRLNRLLNKKIMTRVLVHYNFLSEFSHSSKKSISIISERRFHQLSKDGLDVVYDHYFSELALLYVCHLLSMHLQHAVYYLTRWRSIRLKNEYKLYRRLCREVENDFGYFWFIFNGPHDYDRYENANRKSDCTRGKKIYRSEEIRLRDVRYYDDPLCRLRQLHISQRELTTGNIYESPFPRNDALL